MSLILGVLFAIFDRRELPKFQRGSLIVDMAAAKAWHGEDGWLE
jgi:hypothetical protein